MQLVNLTSQAKSKKKKKTTKRDFLNFRFQRFIIYITMLITLVDNNTNIDIDYDSLSL